MKNIILVLVLLSSGFLNVQAGQKMPNCTNTGSKRAPGMCHQNNNQKDNGVPPPIEHRAWYGTKDYVRLTAKTEYIRVVYCMKDESVHVRQFGTMVGANAFIENDLAHNPDCVSYYIENIK